MPLRPWSSASQFSRLPIPRGETMPTPVMTTRLSMSVRPCCRASGVGLDVLDGVSDRVDLLGVLVADLDLERLLQRHDQLDRVERVRSQIVHEGGLVVTSSGSTPSCSTMMPLTFSSMFCAICSPPCGTPSNALFLSAPSGPSLDPGTAG